MNQGEAIYMNPSVFFLVGTIQKTRQLPLTGQPDRVEEISMRPGTQVGKRHGYVEAGKIMVTGFGFFVFVLRPGISDIYRNESSQGGLSGLYRCCKVSAATKGSCPDAGHVLPSGPASHGTKGAPRPPFLAVGLWDDKDPAGPVLSLWAWALLQ